MHTDRIYSFFNNEMTLDQEREFLISVAASDSLRRDIKSHFNIEKHLNKELNNSFVSEHIRQNIFKNLGVSVVSPKKSFMNKVFGISLMVISTFSLGFYIGNNSSANFTSSKDIGVKNNSNAKMGSVSGVNVGSNINSVSADNQNTGLNIDFKSNDNNTQNHDYSDSKFDFINRTERNISKLNISQNYKHHTKNRTNSDLRDLENSYQTNSGNMYHTEESPNPLNPKYLLNNIRTSPLDPVRLAKPTFNYNKEYETSNPLNPKSFKKHVSGTPLDPVNKGSQIDVPTKVDAGNQ